MINVPIPITLSLNDLQAIIQEVLRRSVDGTVVPLFVDYTNQRVIIGGTASLTNNSVFQVQSGDAEITTAGKGLILRDDGGSGKTCRVTATYNAEFSNWTLTLTTVS